MMVELENQRLPMESLVQLIRLQLSSGGKARLTVTGSSMLPLFRHGVDAVELIPVSGKEGKGDIILYRRENGRYVLHRIIAVEADGYICCGDNQAEREKVFPCQLEAAVNGFVRNGNNYGADHIGYQLYRWAWVELFFFRKPYIALRRTIGRLRTRIRRMHGGKRNG